MLTQKEAERIRDRVMAGIEQRTGLAAKYTLNSCHGCIEWEEAIDEHTLLEGEVPRLTEAQAKEIERRAAPLIRARSHWDAPSLRGVLRELTEGDPYGKGR